MAFRQFEWLASDAVAASDLNWRFEWLAPKAVAYWLVSNKVADLNWQFVWLASRSVP